MTDETEFSMRTEEINAEEVVDAAKKETVEFFRKLHQGRIHEEYDGIIAQFANRNTPIADAFGAMLAVMVTRITDPSQNKTVKDILVRSASVHLAFAHMMSNHPRMKDIRNTMIAVDPLSPVTGDEIDAAATGVSFGDLRSDHGGRVIEDDFSLSLENEIGPEVVKEIVSRHMRAMKEELTAVSEAVGATKN